MSTEGRHRHSEVAIAIREVLLANGEATQSLARRLGLGFTDVTALDHLMSTGDGLGPTELGHRLGIQSASSTALVDRLEAAGHAQRVRHPTDRRRQTVVATDHARSQLLDALAPLFGSIERAAARLTPEQAAAATVFLTEVAEAMREYAARQ